MFDFQTDFRFTAPVKVLVPTLDGQVEKGFTGEFRLVPKEEMDKAVKGKGEEGGVISMRLAFVGWKDDRTQDGKRLPFRDKAREQPLSVPYVIAAIPVAPFGPASAAMLLAGVGAVLALPSLPRWPLLAVAGVLGDRKSVV